MENVGKRVNFDLVNNKKQTKKLIELQEYELRVIFSESLVRVY